RLRFSGPKTSIICSPMTSLKTSIKTITYLSDIGCLEIHGASLEIKHHYPKDLLYRQVQEDIISDISRVIVSPTTHFIHIIQQRTKIKTPSFGQVKFLERDASDISTYVQCLEELSSFPSNFHKKSVCIEVLGEIMSTYTFNVYSFDN
ncbi:hypothetical protein MP997_24910, partial [Escherichia coli]|nr:hypothetical protein [Escherichia coli]MCI3447194.1 hypothetical protein [Escherichia coli]MEB6788276.1 hypothetical protein [Escherichia coli]